MAELQKCYSIQKCKFASVHQANCSNTEFTKALLSSLKYVTITNRSFQLSIIQDIFHSHALQHKKMFYVLSRFYPWINQKCCGEQRVLKVSQQTFTSWVERQRLRALYCFSNKAAHCRCSWHKWILKVQRRLYDMQIKHRGQVT